MRMYDCIMKKKYGESLSEEEIKFIIDGYTNGSIPDYQMSAFLMAVCMKGMNAEETLAMTLAMADSGDRLDLSPIKGKKADKHSTGGVGDKTTLIVGPMVAAYGVPVAKMSGRGLGHTGGTIDKLESFPGFKVDISEEQFFDQVNRIGLSVMAQTANLAPADKKIYALRDVTATVDQMSLIASSVMSKKLAAGADVIVLDVKTGSGAFMKTVDDSIALAQTMVEIGNGAGRSTYAVISDMNQPLGYNIGNILEVQEAIEVLNGGGPEDLIDASCVLAGLMLTGAGKAADEKQGYQMARETLTNGQAFAKFCEFIAAQGGDVSFAEHPENFIRAEKTVEVMALEEGYISSMQTDEIGLTSLMLGAGRETKESSIDLSAGIVMKKKIGDHVKKGETIAVFYTSASIDTKNAEKRFLEAIQTSDKPVEKIQHIHAMVSGDGVIRYQ